MKLTIAQIDHVRSLHDERETITPERVVADAKDKKSPLHDLFEWNKDKASMAHWLVQAREVIVSVPQVRVENQEFPIKSPFYVRDTSMGGEQGYRSVSALRADPPAARESLIYTLEVASGHLRRAFALAGPLGLSAEIDGMIEQITGLQRSIKEAA